MKVLREYLDICAWNDGSRYREDQPRPSMRSKAFWQEMRCLAEEDKLGSLFGSLLVLSGAVCLALCLCAADLYVWETQHLSWQAAVLGGWCLTLAIFGLPLWIREGRRRRDSGEYTRGDPSFVLSHLGFTASLLGVGVALTLGYVPGLFLPAWYAGLSMTAIALALIFGRPVFRLVVRYGLQIGLRLLAVIVNPALPPDFSRNAKRRSPSSRS